MNHINSNRAKREISHGKKLTQADPELIWGWGTPAGRLRTKRRAKLIAAGANLGSGIRALEIGCGTGLFTEMFVETGAQLIAVDISVDLLEKARSRGLPAAQVQFLAKPFEECDTDGPFEAVIGSSVLHHLDIKPALNRIYRLLKPRGVLSFAEPNMLNPQIMLQKNIPWLKARLGDSPDETAFVRWQFQTLLSQAGFENIKITPFDWLHPATPEPLINPVKWLGQQLEQIPVLREFAGSLHICAYRPPSQGI